MKTKILLHLIIFTLMILSVQGQIPLNGLVGSYPFQSNTNDASGNNNNLTNFGATLTTDRFGNPNNAYSFDGISSFMEGTDLDLDSTFTISLWVNPIDSVGSMISKYDNTANSSYEFIYNESDRGLYFHVGLPFVQTNVLLTLNRWQHAVFVYNRTIAKIYLNDSLIISQDSVDYPPLNNILLKVGKSAWGGNIFKGKLDDINIYNRALDSTEIQQLYNDGQNNNSCLVGLLPFSLNQGLVAWYPFCGNANDESGNGHNGVLNGATLTSDRWGNVSSAYQFNGIDEFIEVPSTPELGLNKMFSISLWFNTDSAVGTNPTYRPTFISKERYIDGTGYQMGYDIDSKPILGVNNDPFGPPLCPPCNLAIFGLGSISFNQWNHLVGIWNRDSLFLYENGILISSGNGHLQGDSLLVSTMSLFIGKEFSSSPPPFPTFFKGNLDDIRIYNRVISSSEVNALYNEGLCMQTITVTDTLIINANLTGFNPITYQNSIKVYPNPARDHIVIDCGTNYNTINGYTLRIENSLSQSVFTTVINQQTYNVDLNSWTGAGVYFVYLIDNLGHTIQVRKIVIQ